MEMTVFTVFWALSMLVLAVKAESERVVSLTWDKKYSFYPHEGIVPGYIAVAAFRNEVNTTGWSYLNVTTVPGPPDDIQSYAAGILEGYITAKFINMSWSNTLDGYCTPPYTVYCSRLQTFLRKNMAWMEDQITLYYNTSDYWRMVSHFLIQLDGLHDGYKYGMGKAKIDGMTRPRDLDVLGLYLIQVSGDLEDLEAALGKEQPRRVKGSGSCSALIKLLPGNKDLYVSHDTWNSYQDMLRMLKKYSFSYSTVNKGAVPGNTMTFSSYPGMLLSGDDYYLIGSGLVTLETTIGNSNPDLWKYVTTQNSVPEGIRTMVSNRLASSGTMWTDIFKQYNSGTYNNQWMVVDYKKFVPGSNNMTDVLYILEQIPGLIAADDETEVLMKQSYWPSYNIPYFDSIFNQSGGNEMVQKYGDWFSYKGSPRYKIFQREHSKVVDLKSMIRLMRYNDFMHDPLSKCNCTPPYSAENAISARNDLNPANGTYPFGALGHRSHGGTDMKLTDSTMFKRLEFIAISGPTFDQLPPFQWSKADFSDACPHHGHPDLFKFDPVSFDGTTDFKPFKR